jgi:regulator of sirC expression with transglutaminase-like and TPR domain
LFIEKHSVLDLPASIDNLQNRDRRIVRTLATDLFREMISRPPEQIELAKAALLIALDEYPALNLTSYLERIGAVARRVSAQLSADPTEHPLEAIECINRQLFKIEGFRGNQDDYYDPRNSFLNEVIDRKTGIPITLSVLYMEIGRRIGLEVEGVGMPGHFIVKCKKGDLDIFVDPFAQGEILLEADCQRKLTQLHGKNFQFRRSYLDVVDHRQILTRMLHNLKGIYWNEQNYAKAVGIIEKILLINPRSASEFRDRGFAHHQLNHLSSAIDDLSRYLELQPGAHDAEEVRKKIKIAARMVAFRN